MTRRGAVASQMFGMRCLKSGGKAFAGVHEDCMVVKLKGEAQASALGLTGAHLFDPSGRRPMKAWVMVPDQPQAKWSKLATQALGRAGRPRRL